MTQHRLTLRKIQQSAVAIVAIGALSTPALSAPALTRAPAAMREGPSRQAPVVQPVPPNTVIDVRGCQGAWCYVSWRYIFGYLPTAAIDPRPLPGAGPPPPPPVVVAPAIGFGWSFGAGRW